MKECPLCFLCLEDRVDTCPDDGRLLQQRFAGTCIIDGKYRLERRLGSGGMGVVYRATHLGLQRTFALKMIKPSRGNPDETFIARFHREAETLGRLKHPNIVDVTDFGIDSREEGISYLVMEYLEGTTFESYGRAKGPASVSEILPLIVPIAEALDYAHRQHILHRDLKSANALLIHDQDGSTRVKIVDFGLARFYENDLQISSSNCLQEPKLLAKDSDQFETVAASDSERITVYGDSTSSPQITARGTILGTPAYMAPELIRGEQAAPASDIYAFGCLIYELVTGQTPFDGSKMKVLEDHLREPPTPPQLRNKALSAGIGMAILSALQKEPEKRPATAMDLIRQIRKAWQRDAIARWHSREFPRRMVMAILLALFVGYLGPLLGRLDVIRELENRCVDLRFRFAASHPPAASIALLIFDEKSSRQDSTSLADRGDEFGEKMEKVFSAGARGVALDFLPAPKWSGSQKWIQLVLHHTNELTFGVYSKEGKTTGTEGVQGMATAVLGPDKISSLFAFTNLDVDEDGVLRRVMLRYRDTSGKERDIWAAHAARRLAVEIPQNPGPYWIDYSIAWETFQKISWMDLETVLQEDPDRLRGKLVLVGGDFSASGDEAHRIPSSAGLRQAPGIILQALIVNSILEGFPFRDASWRLILQGILLIIGVLILCDRFQKRALMVSFVFVLLFAGGAAFAFDRWHRIVPVVPSAILCLGMICGSWILRRKLSPFPKMEEP